MPLTPLDIHNKEFRKGFRGYNEAEVDEFLDEVVREFESLLKDNAALREQIETLYGKTEQYRQIEDTLHNTLVMAQRTAEEVRANAQKEAELTLKEAALHAEELTQEAQLRVQRINEEFNELRGHVQHFRARVRGLVRSYLELLDQHDAEPELGSAAVLEGHAEAAGTRDDNGDPA